MRNSLNASQAAGIFTGIGTACGSVIHVLYSLAGVSVLISQSLELFTILKLIGALYLIYLGIKTLGFTKSSFNFESERTDTVSRFQAFKMGFFCNLLNPKASVFFLGLFTTVVTPQTPLWALVSITGIMVVQNIGWFSLIAIGMGHKQVQAYYIRFQHIFRATLGGLLILLGLKVALSRI